MKYELYQILFPNGKSYFGITSIGHKRRFQEHVNYALNGNSNLPVSCAIRKFGKNDIQLKCLVVGDREYIETLEILIISRFESLVDQFGYNLHLGGTTSPMKNPEVARRNQQTKLDWSDEFRKDFGLRMVKIFQNWRKGLTVEQREQLCNQLSNLHKLRWSQLSEPEKNKFRNSQLGKPSKKKGIKLSDEVCEKIRIGVQNRDETWLANVTAANQVLTPSRMQALAKGPEACRGIKRPEISKLMSSLTWVTDGKSSRRIRDDQEIPEGWQIGRASWRNKPILPEIIT